MLSRTLTGVFVFSTVLLTVSEAESQALSEKTLTINSAAEAEEKTKPSLLLTRRTRETFAEIRAACSQPAGSQDWTAVEWLLTTAQDQGWEGELEAVTGQLLSTPPDSPTLMAQVRAVQVVGHARRGEAEAAMAAFDATLKGVRLRQPQPITDLAVSTALAFQLNGDLDAARAIYERVNSAFFLNTEVRDFVAYRLERLGLIGKPAPAVALNDLDGKSIVWADYQGKVLVLDFWATNCRPCLEELPRLKRFYHDRDTDKVALLGISLDEDAADIARLHQLESLPWPIALDQKKATFAFKVVLIPCLMAVDHAGKVAAVDIPPRALRSTVSLLVDRISSSK